MKKLCTLLVFLLPVVFAFQSAKAQKNSDKNIYRFTETKISGLVHTKVDVRFDYNRTWLYGKAWITLHPHFYATDSAVLDAKGMTIQKVGLSVNGKIIPLRYAYDSMNLRIALSKRYKATESYTLYVEYIAKPNEYKAVHPSLMPGEKGLYFINPKGDLKEWPVQIWTQGETEANSYWVPTIDKPNQKTTTEIVMTVPAKYKTLSNGLLVGTKKNADGTRTDTWKMNLPHAPYLMFMGVGDYAVIKDSYKGKEVSYYVEKEYAPYARKIFGDTPEMMAFFSRITGVDFPWQKYAQITGRNYIFGAMENTTATLHEESSQQDARQLLDGNIWETIIAHELFHQWFGDYVTAESWSNITVNESFADYSETLWREYKYGKEAGEAQRHAGLAIYLANPAYAGVDLVRFKYENAIEAFDGVGYQKGGCILHMLRSYLGDSAFFKSINVYLTQNKFQSAEAQNVRLAFEQVSGRDLNWFFNQWYYSSGHPVLDITYSYDDAAKISKVFIAQKQPGIFKLPIDIDVYEGSNKKRYNVWMNDSTATFSFSYNAKPDLINVDADKVLVSETIDHKTAGNFIFQYNHTNSYINRREAISYFLNNKTEPKRIDFLLAALDDKNDELRSYILKNISAEKDSTKNALRAKVEGLASNDPKPVVRSRAIAFLASLNDAQYKPLFIKFLTDSSYSIAGQSLLGLSRLDSAEALARARLLSKQAAKGDLLKTLLNVFSKYGDDGDRAYVYNTFRLAGTSERLGMMEPYFTALTNELDNNYVKQQVDLLVAFKNDLPAFLSNYGGPLINGGLLKLAAAKRSSGDQQLGDYIKALLPAGEK